MHQDKKIVIIGAGYGGVNAAKVLYKNIKKIKGSTITLIDKNPYHTLLTELHEVAGGKFEPEALKVYLKKIFAGTAVNTITDEVVNIDFADKTVFLKKEKLKYDYLIIGTGAEPVFFGIPGVKENCLTLWSLDDAIKIKDHIEKMFLLASRESDPVKRKEHLTFIVAGAGLTGVEFIGELLNWKKNLCERYYIDKDEVELVIIEAQKNILPTLPEKLQLKSRKYLERKKVKVLTESPITEVSQNILFINKKEAFKSDTIIWTCGVEGGSFAKKCGLSKEINSRLKVNEYMQSIDRPDVYIIGDIAWYKDKESAHPQIVETALQTGENAACNIIREICGKEKIKLKTNYHGQMVSIGSYYGVANLMNFKMSGFTSLVMKHLVNIHYLFVVAGANQVWEYIKHHFLDVKDNRSLVGGHAAGKTRFYWIILLRLFLGIMWIIEGGSKVYNGWLDPANIKIVQMPSVDGTTAATEESTEAVSEDKEAAVSTDSDTAATENEEGTSAESSSSYPKAIMKPLWIYKWFEQTVIVKFAFVFQAFVVITEILIGLAILGGLFTFIASAGSIGLSLMFIVSGMASKEIFWFIFAAIAVMGGAGKSAGLDYWVMPWIKKWWNSQKLAWRTYFYIDNPVFKKKGKKKQ